MHVRNELLEKYGKDRTTSGGVLYSLLYFLNDDRHASTYVEVSQFHHCIMVKEMLCRSF